MDNVRPADKDATLGLDQAYRPLHIRTVEIDGHPCLQSVWRPTAEELAVLNAGGYVTLNMLSNAHPPVRLDVEPSS